MREIKFRAWDKINKGFINGFNMLGYGLGNGSPTRKLKRFDTTWHENDVELMQFTGMYGKGGKEIYEGDIVLLDIPDKIHSKAVVKFSDGCFDVVHSFGRDYLKCYVANHAVEVLGNIYQNPELLEVQQCGK